VFLLPLRSWFVTCRDLVGKVGSRNVEDSGFAGNTGVDFARDVPNVSSSIFGRDQAISRTKKEIGKQKVCFFLSDISTSSKKVFRLSYDAALNKAERLKNSKKEKDRQEADDELEAAKSK
jgi:hypothetical protein